jgi:hypothetical protein
MTVSWYGRSGWAPFRQRNGSPDTTRLRGTLAAESAPLGASGSVTEWPSTSGPKLTVPASARA